MSASIAGVLAVDKRAVGFAVALNMRQRKLQVLRRVVGRFVNGAVTHLAFEQVEQAVLRVKFLAIKREA